MENQEEQGIENKVLKSAGTNDNSANSTKNRETNTYNNQKYSRTCVSSSSWLTSAICPRFKSNGAA